MREILSRLRAALTPQSLAILALLALLFVSLQTRNEDSLESRTASTLCAVDGAGRVKVTIRTKDVQQSSGLLGAGQAERVPVGAVAVAQGADDPLVAIRLQEALCALLGLPASSVSVITGGK